MIALPDSVWPYAAFGANLIGALLSVGAGLYVARYGDRTRTDRRAMLAASGGIALVCIGALAFPANPGAALARTVQNLALLWLVFVLFAVDGRDESLRPARPLVGALFVVQLCQPAILIMRAYTGSQAELTHAMFEGAVLLDMLVAIGALVLVHNLHGGATASARPLIRRSTIALAGIFAYALNASTIAWLIGQHPAGLVAFQGLFSGAMAVLFAFGSNGAAGALQFRASRTVTFQSLSLLLIAAYVAVMFLVLRSLALWGEDIARTSQALFLVLAIVAALVWLPSQRMRDRLRMMAAKHLFQHRYDYREEWLRFTRTIGRGPGHDTSLHERAIKAMADITESPAGLLLMPNERAQLELTARWNWSTLDVPAIAAQYELASLLETNDHILALDDVRVRADRQAAHAQIPDWLIEAEDAWALVPLIHYERLVGVIVLVRPRIERQLDWEDHDLLRVVGRQLASYLAEQAGQQALMDASRFEEFNRRMAFVMHDIKNLASQLSLLSTNAQKHSENPDFRADMLVTLRNSSDKLNALLDRLGRYGSMQQTELSPVDLADAAHRLTERFEPLHPVVLTTCEPVCVQADPGMLEQALVHLVQNAIDASEPDQPVFLAVSRQGLNGEIEITDTGRGMSAQFVRTGLFKPFVSTKQSGFGIGAFEARETIRAIGGRLSVQSREGIGTRFCVALPCVEAARASAAPLEIRQERAA